MKVLLLHESGVLADVLVLAEYVPPRVHGAECVSVDGTENGQQVSVGQQIVRLVEAVPRAVQNPQFDTDSLATNLQRRA